MTVGLKARAGSAKTKMRSLPIERAAEADENTILIGTGNVFADLGFADAEERKAKADLALGIKKLVEKNGWTQREAAKKLSTSQPTLSSLWAGKLSSITYDKLTEWYLVLGKSVRITVYTPRKHDEPRLEVAVG